MNVFGNTMSPFVRKTLAFAAEKGIAVELVQAGMGQGPDEFKKASPFGKMPGFQDGDFLISDSTAIITYLEAIQPEPNLIPTEPRGPRPDHLVRGISPTPSSAPASARCSSTAWSRRSSSAGRATWPPPTRPRRSSSPSWWTTSRAWSRRRASWSRTASPWPTSPSPARSPTSATPAAPSMRRRIPRRPAYVEAILARPSYAGIIAKERAILEGMAKREPA